MIYTITLNPAIDRELLVEEFKFDSVLRANRWQVDLGGKGFNVSRLLLGFDTPSTALGFIGGDSGRQLKNGLRQLGIANDFTMVDGETRTNISIRSETQSRYIKVNEPGPTVTSKDVRLLLEKIKALAKPGDWWILAGSLPPGCPEDIYQQIITLVQSRGSKSVLDASGKALELGCLAGPYLCKPNLLEAQHLIGRFDESPLGAAAGVLEAGAANVVLSLGKEGAVYRGTEGSFTFTAPRIAEKNPIGSGDAMVGAMVWALQQGLSFVEAVRWGVAGGAATASLEGTSLAKKSEVQTLLSQVLVS